MPQSFFTSDTHFGHKNILQYCTRPFSSVEEMDETLIEAWNATVGLRDTVYHLGDVAINRKSLPLISRCNGRKVLIKGNHDIFKLNEYWPMFEDIRSYKVYPQHGIICSHIPVHTSQLEHRFKHNVHGHTHDKLVTKMGVVQYFGRNKNPVMGQVPDDRYINVCVEHTNYCPISLEEILERTNDN